VFPKNYFRAVEFYQKACDLGNGSACRKLAWMHARGLGTKADSSKAYEYLKKACDLGEEEACKMKF